MTVLALAGNVLSVDGSFLFIFVSIFVLIFILNRTLFSPINKILDERERLGVGRLDQAKGMLIAYEQQLTQYEEQLRAARAEAYQNLEAQRREAQTIRQETLAQVRTETSAQIAEAQSAIREQAEAAKENLQGEARQMAATISSQLLHRPVTDGGN